MIDTIEIPYYTSPMAMGKRPRNRQPTMWVPMTELPTSASHPFYARLNQLLHDRGFDDPRAPARLARASQFLSSFRFLVFAF